MSFQKLQCFMLLWNKKHSRVKMATEDAEWPFPTDIWALISSLLETETKNVASDPRLRMAVSLQVSPPAVLEKADSSDKTRLGQMLRTNLETLIAAICRCSHQQWGQWKQRHDQALCKAGSYLTTAAAMTRSPSQKPPKSLQFLAFVSLCVKRCCPAEVF